MQWSHGGLFKDILHEISMFNVKDILRKRRSVIWFIPVLYYGLEYLTSSLCYCVSMCHNFIDFLREKCKGQPVLVTIRHNVGEKENRLSSSCYMPFICNLWKQTAIIKDLISKVISKEKQNTFYLFKQYSHNGCFHCRVNVIYRYDRNNKKRFLASRFVFTPDNLQAV